MISIKKRIYHALVFPFSLGFFTPFLMAHLSLSMTASSFNFNHEIISFLCLVIAGFTSVIFAT